MFQPAKCRFHVGKAIHILGNVNPESGPLGKSGADIINDWVDRLTTKDVPPSRSKPFQATIFNCSSAIIAFNKGRTSWKGRMKVRSCCITHTKRV